MTPQTDEEIAEMIARFRTPPQCGWEDLRNDILLVLRMRRKSADQMIAALTEIRDKAATMPNGGAWAGGLAMLCLGTLSDSERPPH